MQLIKAKQPPARNTLYVCQLLLKCTFGVQNPLYLIYAPWIQTITWIKLMCWSVSAKQKTYHNNQNLKVYNSSTYCHTRTAKSDARTDGKTDRQLRNTRTPRGLGKDRIILSVTVSTKKKSTHNDTLHIAEDTELLADSLIPLTLRPFSQESCREGCMCDSWW